MKQVLIFVLVAGTAFAAAMGLASAGSYAVTSAITGVQCTRDGALFWFAFGFCCGFMAAALDTINDWLRERRAARGGAA